jgi:quercetin dioxygenase-like cupin family protein
MIEEAAPGGVRLYFVRFEPGGRTFWHYHDGQQLLVVTEGSCQVQKRGGPVVELGVGDVARFEAGEEHWHGAAGEAPMEHSAITAGTKTHWLQEVD